MSANKKGKLIVLEGTDGSGKTTQAALLKNWFEMTGMPFEMADFPQYNSKSAGLVEEYLEGKYGTADEVNPYQASVFYAVDRYDASFKISRWLSEGKFVIANRYAFSSMAHQGAKIDSKLKRRTFYDWVYNLEYNLFEIPRPDAVFLLHVPAAIARAQARSRQRIDWYGKTGDIHEDSPDHLEKAEAVYLEIARLYPNIFIIPCTEKGQMMPRDEISRRLWDKVSEVLKIDAKRAAALPVAPNFKILHEKSESEILPGLSGSSDYYPIKKPLTPDGAKYPLAAYLSDLELHRMPTIKGAKQPENASFSANPGQQTKANNQGLHYDGIDNLKQNPRFTVSKIQPQAKLPQKKSGDSMYELYSSDFYSIFPSETVFIRTGLKFGIPAGYIAQVWDARRNSLLKFIDTGDRKELAFYFRNNTDQIIHIAPGDTIALLMMQNVAAVDLTES